MAGRGRGRGRGPAILPFTDEETGKRVSLDVDAPPKLFPVSPNSCCASCCSADCWHKAANTWYSWLSPGLVLSRPQDLELPEVTEGTEQEKALMVSCTRSVSLTALRRTTCAAA